MANGCTCPGRGTDARTGPVTVSIRTVAAVLVAMFLLAAWIDDPSLHRLAPVVQVP